MLAQLLWLTLAQSTPNAHDILERAIATTATNLDARRHYIYREHAEHQLPNGTITFTDDYEWIYLENAPYRKHVATNGHPLTGKALRDSERLFQMTAAERKADQQHRKPNPRLFSADLEPATVLAVMNHTLDPEIITLNGRPSWVIHSEPKPDTSGEPRAYRFTFAIDQADLAIAQIHYDIVQAGANLLPGSTQTTTYSKIADHVWLATIRESEYFSGPPHPRGHWKQLHRLSDYQRFGTQATVLFEH